MRAEDKPAFAALILSLCESYRREASEALLEGYWIGLEDCSLEDVKRAIRTALKESRFMPSAAELGQMVSDRYRHRAGLPERTGPAIDAGSALRAARERLGLTSPVGRRRERLSGNPEAEAILNKLASGMKRPQ